MITFESVTIFFYQVVERAVTVSPLNMKKLPELARNTGLMFLKLLIAFYTVPY